MKLKIDEAGNVVVQDGKPVYVGEDGREAAYDPIAMHATISRLNREAQTHREAKEAAESALEAFEGLDPAQAKKAIEIAANLDQSKLIDAGKVEEIKSAAIKSVEEKYKPIVEAHDKLQRDLYSERMGAKFASSKFIQERTILPPDIAQATFGNFFDLKDGKIIAKDPNGNPIYSDANPGNLADFDEAIEKLVSGYTHRDRILKGTGHSGSGAVAVDGGAGTRRMTREQFGKLNATAQAKYVQAIREGSAELID
jgi:hypothetical protein